MENTINLILEIIKYKNKNYSVQAMTIDEVIVQDVVIFACALKDSDGLLKTDSIIYDINDLTNFELQIYKESFDDIVNEMFKEYKKIDVEKRLYLCISKNTDLTGFEKIYNETVHIYNSLPIYQRKKLLNNNLLCSEETEYKLLTTYFEVLSRPNYKEIMNYLKKKGLKIDINQKMYK